VKFFCFIIIIYYQQVMTSQFSFNTIFYPQKVVYQQKILPSHWVV